MSEKVKGMFGSKTRFSEIISWLRSQGAKDNSLEELINSTNVIYYVNREGQAMYTHAVHGELFEIVELPRWRAEINGKYYFVSDSGYVGSSSEELGEVDDERYECGNYFKTNEEAEQYAEKIREIFKRKE